MVLEYLFCGVLSQCQRFIRSVRAVRTRCVSVVVILSRMTARLLIWRRVAAAASVCSRHGHVESKDMFFLAQVRLPCVVVIALRWCLMFAMFVVVGTIQLIDVLLSGCNPRCGCTLRSWWLADRFPFMYCLSLM